MRKFTFTTLMMILGMSSVSFGKEYLCVSTYDVHPLFHQNKWNIQSYGSSKYVIKTDKEGKKILSFKNFGQDYIHCPMNPKDDPLETLTPQIQQYVKRNNDRQVLYKNGVISCRSTWVKGKTTMMDINFEPKRMKFHIFSTGFHDSISLTVGKCEEM